MDAPSLPDPSNTPVLRVLGRFLQVLGLLLLPAGLYAGMVLERGMTVELGFLGAGVVVFLSGRALLGSR